MPLQACLHFIEDACSDSGFHLQLIGRQIQLWNNHDYYFQVMGQLAITESAFYDLVTWTCNDVHIIRINLDNQLWGDMLRKLKDFYITSLGPEIIRRLGLM